MKLTRKEQEIALGTRQPESTQPDQIPEVEVAPFSAARGGMEESLQQLSLGEKGGGTPVTHWGESVAAKAGAVVASTTRAAITAASADTPDNQTQESEQSIAAMTPLPDSDDEEDPISDSMAEEPSPVKKPVVRLTKIAPTEPRPKPIVVKKVERKIDRERYLHAVCSPACPPHRAPSSPLHTPITIL
jgi:hypothetical protein